MMSNSSKQARLALNMLPTSAEFLRKPESRREQQREGETKGRRKATIHLLQSSRASAF
jgi:hypothetical protein